jgi:hypothetical protein
VGKDGAWKWSVADYILRVNAIIHMLTGTFIQGIHYQDGHISALIVQIQHTNTIYLSYRKSSELERKKNRGSVTYIAVSSILPQ